MVKKSFLYLTTLVDRQRARIHKVTGTFSVLRSFSMTYILSARNRRNEKIESTIYKKIIVFLILADMRSLQNKAKFCPMEMKCIYKDYNQG